MNRELEIEQLIAARDRYQLDRDAIEFARIGLRLGSLYMKRRIGKPTENYQIALQLLEEAMRVFRRHEKLDEYLQCQKQLGSLCLEWATVAGSFWIEKAIHHLELGLTECPRDEYLGRWCLFQLLLSISYRNKETKIDDSSAIADRHEQLAFEKLAEENPSLLQKLKQLKAHYIELFSVANRITELGGEVN